MTTAEEMPANETVSMFEQLRDQLRMPTGFLFVNRVHDSEISATDVKRLSEAAARRRDSREKKILLEVAARAREESGWTRVNAHHLTRLAEDVAMPMVEIPFLFCEEFGFAELRRVADAIVAARVSGRERQRRA